MIIPGTKLPRHPTNLCQTLSQLELATYSILTQARRSKISLDETAITSLNLLTLASLHPTEVVVVDHKGMEAKTGADWEWWFIGRKRVRGMRVQAKRLYVKGHSYPKLLEKNKNGRQVDLLIADAKKTGTLPIYCFYNSDLRPKDVPSWKCGTYPKNVASMGCAIASADRILGCINKNTLRASQVTPYCRPWSCLTCCPQANGLVERVDAVLADLLGVGTDGIVLPPQTRDALPPHVLSAVDAQFAVTPNVALPRGLSHLVVVIERDQP